MTKKLPDDFIFGGATAAIKQKELLRLMVKGVSLGTRI